MKHNATNSVKVSLQIVTQIQPREGFVTRCTGDRNSTGHLSSEHEMSHMHMLAFNFSVYVGVSAERRP